MTRGLVVNADDFGLCPAVNEGVIRAHLDGVVTSASLMVRSPHAPEAVAMAREHPGLSLGLHLDVGEWARDDEGWKPVYQVVPPDDAAALQAELHSQLSRFEDMAGAPPTHIDSHQHVHIGGPLTALVFSAGRRLGVPVRRTWGGLRYRGDFYGQSGDGHPYPEGIGVAAMLRLLRQIGDGVTEVACHPAVAGPVASVYACERSVELETLTHPDVRAAVDACGLTLVPFAAVAPYLHVTGAAV
jgi:predicted glycoside hydrolase/deacetylase ChbG (UPF0249 family)